MDTQAIDAVTFVVTCWEKADLLALVCNVELWSCHFPIGILGQVWCLIVSIPDICPHSYIAEVIWRKMLQLLSTKTRLIFSYYLYLS